MQLAPPSGEAWLHEIKHDGFRVIARKDGERVRLYSRPGNDLTARFPLIAEALARLRSRSCIIDGEAVACGDNGVAAFELIRRHRVNDRAFLYAFDLIELNGDDLRRDPLQVRKATLTSVLAKGGPGVRFNEHLEYDDGDAVFRHACKMGLEGIVSKRKDSPSIGPLAALAQEQESERAGNKARGRRGLVFEKPKETQRCRSMTRKSRS